MPRWVYAAGASQSIHACGRMDPLRAVRQGQRHARHCVVLGRQRCALRSLAGAMTRSAVSARWPRGGSGVTAARRLPALACCRGRVRRHGRRAGAAGRLSVATDQAVGALASGGATDVAMRLLADLAGRALGQPVMSKTVRAQAARWRCRCCSRPRPMATRSRRCRSRCSARLDPEGRLGPDPRHHAHPPGQWRDLRHRRACCQPAAQPRGAARPARKPIRTS